MIVQVFKSFTFWRQKPAALKTHVKTEASSQVQFLRQKNLMAGGQNLEILKLRQ